MERQEQIKYKTGNDRDVTTGTTGTTEVVPKFSDTLTLFLIRRGAECHYPRGCTKKFTMDKSLNVNDHKKLLAAGLPIDYKQVCFD